MQELFRLFQYVEYPVAVTPRAKECFLAVPSSSECAGLIGRFPCSKWWGGGERSLKSTDPRAICVVPVDNGFGWLRGPKRVERLATPGW